MGKAAVRYSIITIIVVVVIMFVIIFAIMFCISGRVLVHVIYVMYFFSESKANGPWHSTINLLRAFARGQTPEAWHSPRIGGT